MNIVGPQVRQIRESKGMTQEDLVVRCNLQKWDISRSTLAKIESQVRRVTDEEVVRLAKALRVEIKDLY
jgi:transcriptional regulator with XRE-family HTH domain